MVLTFRLSIAAIISLLILSSVRVCAQQPFTLAPAIVVEAEDFTVERGWSSIKMGEGNYCVDTIGFSHCSGERFLHCLANDASASAFLDVVVPEAAPYRLWVRYEYMPFTETRFKVIVEQEEKVIAEKVMGAKDSPKTCPWSDGTTLMAQTDPPWGNEGILEEPLDIPALAAGSVRLRLLTVDQPIIPGISTNRNIDMCYLTMDTIDEWRRQPPYDNWYGILYAAVDSLGARYEVQFANRGNEPVGFSIYHVYNRAPWGSDDPDANVSALAPGETSSWLPIKKQDTSHKSLVWFTPSAAQPFTVAVRPVGNAQAEETVVSPGERAGIFLPPYPGKGEKAISANSALTEIISAVKTSPAPGVTPTKPLCYGWTVPYSQNSEYGKKYAELYAALGMRSFISGHIPDENDVSTLKSVGIGISKSAGYVGYRFPPTVENIALAKKEADDKYMTSNMRWFDYGDEIGFAEWLGYIVEEEKAARKNPDLTMESVVLPMWQAWLKKNRPGFKPGDYWRSAWGKLNPAQLRPDSSVEASSEKPRLFVDSTIFYEDVAIAWVAKGAKAIKQTFGPDVLSGANYTCYPYYYPHSTMYIKWFRGGAADFGRHSEYFWQLGQVTPMVNGFISEYFRAGMRNNPSAIVKQYTMPHSPGNTDASFRRTAFSHLAHGVKNLDFFGMGMNETFTENYIDHRDTERFVAIRDITHSMGLVEDVLEQSQVVPSKVAMLVSESTERWDHSGIALDFVSFDYGPNFRKDRLTYHQERVGLYTALTFAGTSPDILVEEDVVNPKILNGYKVLFLVGDSIPGNLTPALEKWVKAGGVVFATAGVGRYGVYKEANPALRKFVGVAQRSIQEKDTFMRTSQELPFLKPLTTVKGNGWQFPALAYRERFTPAKGAKVLATFQDDNTPAMIVRQLGKGKVYFLAALPGLAYLWGGLSQPIWVPDRGPGAHREVTNYDKNAAVVIGLPLSSIGILPQVSTCPGYIDTRLIRGEGAFILPIANYNVPNDQQVTISIRPPVNAKAPTSVTSAFCGPLPVIVREGAWEITLPKLGYGDIVRINVK